MVWQPESVAKARNMTPGCENVIHFNNAGAGLMPQPVLEAVQNHLLREATIGGYEAARAAHSATERAYETIAGMLNARAEEIAIVENATRAWDMFFYSLHFQRGDRILVSRAEYASNYIAMLQVAKRTGAILETIPNDEYGATDADALDAMIDERAKLIAITHVPTNGGLINPAIAIGKVAKKHGIPYLLDACQSAGQIPLDVKEIGCDALSATGRKYLRGPRGTGFLFVRKKLLKQIEPVFLDLHAATWTGPSTFEIAQTARRFENWEGYVAGKIGLGVAVDHARTWGLDNIFERVSFLADWLRDTLTTVPRVRVWDIGKNKCGIVSFSVENQNASDVARQLSEAGINVSVSEQASTFLDMEARGLDNVIRASVHYYNTEKEIATFVDVLAAIIQGG